MNSQCNLSRNAASKHATFILTAVLATLEYDMPFLVALLFQTRKKIHEYRA
jgi:hypothetical protein